MIKMGGLFSGIGGFELAGNPAANNSRYPLTTAKIRINKQQYGKH